MLIHASMNPSVHPSMHPCMHIIHPSIYSSIHPSMNPSIHASVHAYHPSTNRSMHPSINIFIPLMPTSIIKWVSTSIHSCMRMYILRSVPLSAYTVVDDDVDEDDVTHHNLYVLIIITITRQVRPVRMRWEPLSSASCRWKEPSRSPRTAGGQRRASWYRNPAQGTSGEWCEGCYDPRVLDISSEEIRGFWTIHQYSCEGFR